MNREKRLDQFAKVIAGKPENPDEGTSQMIRDHSAKHATELAARQIDPNENLYDGDRPVPITDLGTPIAELF